MLPHPPFRQGFKRAGLTGEAAQQVVQRAAQFCRK